MTKRASLDYGAKYMKKALRMAEPVWLYWLWGLFICC